MPAKVKEIKDDAIIDIKVNKSYYLMCKTLSYWIVKQLDNGEGDPTEKLKQIMSDKFENLSDIQKAFYTIALLLAEIESQADNQDLLEEKEILLPGDEGYVVPVLPSED
tara:strand:- start:1651 stop:1977 length:327 start_codon:yes stop_codon:yes gene_type:complete